MFSGFDFVTPKKLQYLKARQQSMTGKQKKFKNVYKKLISLYPWGFGPILKWVFYIQWRV